MRTTWRFSLIFIGLVLTLFGRPYMVGSAEQTGVRDRDGDMEPGLKGRIMAHTPPLFVVAERFVDNGDGTITDTRRKLMWQQGDNEQEVTFAEAQQYCRNLRLGDHADWRLPTPAEGETAAVFQLMMPRHARDVYAHFDLYWSSDPTMLLPFNYRPAQGREISRVYPATGGQRAFVRCVRSLGTGAPGSGS
ncbi:MAG: DUF1566 domain-containing protein [Syntrophorhabdales bacterium]|jgi:hypothetical protein